MSAKTKIVVLHMKELIYTGIFAALGILFIVLLIKMFLSDSEGADPGEVTATAAASVYIPGIYTTELILNGSSVDVEVIVDKDNITSIRLVNLSESITTMYPLLEPTLESICTQVYESQSLENISYTTDSKYTSLVLLEAIKSSVEKARPRPTPTASPSP